MHTKNIKYNKFFIIIYFCTLSSCNKEEADVRLIRGHTLSLQGIPHSIGLQNPNHYCQQCHGTDLVGGSKLEPSCFQCHGQNWQVTEKDSVNAPTNHTFLLDEWLHDPLLEQASSECSGCHGIELKGQESNQAPSCYLCHNKLWE